MISLFSFDYPPRDGGISRLCSAIADGVGRRGRAVRVVTEAARGPGAAAPTVPEVRLRSDRPRREWEAFRAMRRPGSGPLICGIWYPEGLLAMLAGARDYVVLAHGNELMPTPSRWRRGTWRRLQRRVLMRSRLVVANSEYTRRLVLEGAPGCKVVAVPLAVDHRRFAPGDRDAAKRALGVAGGRVIGSVARLQTYKGHGVVFRALAALPDSERGQFTYLVAGRGPDERRLRDEAEALGLADTVRWLGFVAEGDLPALYRAMDLFALCTRESPDRREVEGFGLAFLEAQACGTPVVGTRTGGIPDAVEDGDGGWLIEQDDAPALARLLRRLAGDPDSFRLAGAEGRARVERGFTWEHYFRRFEAALSAEGLSLD